MKPLSFSFASLSCLLVVTQVFAATTVPGRRAEDDDSITMEDMMTTTPLSTSVTTLMTSLMNTTEMIATEGESYLNYTKVGQSEKCIDLMMKSDRCVQEALFIGKDYDEIRMPKTEEDLDYYCDRLKTTMQCLMNYKVCLRMMPKTLFGVMARDAKKSLKSICSSPVNRKTALQHLKCFQKEKIPFYYNMINAYANVLVRLSKPDIKLDELIGSCCCAFHVVYQSGIELIDRECRPLTGIDTGLFVGNLVRTVASSALDVSCGKHSSIEVCHQLQPNEMKTYDQLLNEGMKKRFSFSMVIPLIKILNNLDQTLTTDGQ